MATETTHGGQVAHLGLVAQGAQVAHQGQVPPAAGDPAAGAAIRVREADSVKLPNLPDVGGFRQWKRTARAAICAASGRGGAVFSWVLAAEDPTATLDALSNSEGHDSLDAKLASAIEGITSGEVAANIGLHADREARRGRLLTGRQALKIVHDYYRADADEAAVYGVAELLAVEYSDAIGVPQFLANWDTILAGMRQEPERALMEVLILKQMRACSLLREDVAYYDRLPTAHPDRTYTFLHAAVRRCVKRLRQEEVREAMRKTLVRATKDEKVTQPAVPATSEAEERGADAPQGQSRGQKGKGHGKGARDRSESRKRKDKGDK